MRQFDVLGLFPGTNEITQAEVDNLVRRNQVKMNRVNKLILLRFVFFPSFLDFRTIHSLV